MDDDDKTLEQESEHGRLIADLRAEVLKQTDGESRARLLARIDRLESSMHTASFGEHVKALVEEAEEEAAALGPFMSRLSSLLP
ncbi:hypothetical protein [Enhydrobacter sp.]|jgi:hypothetical protein|uniref:hypothetical protein n=1 Tax=Enhydrobacter sp. TaxID=1894999 RepID=UPI00261BEB02|nr:hypothetical protein [Enhydrobacter sp.]WIM12004.1 MAG: hypothetical protein OJF58_002964 [Enhydrobacter sp.]